MKDNYILYLLVLSSKEAFKVGISSLNNFERILFLSKMYSFDFENSYVITGNSKIIKLLERQLLVDYSKYKYSFLNKKDGSSEFLKIDCFQMVLEDVEFKKRLKHVFLNINKGIIFNRIKKLPKKEIKLNTTQNTNEFSLDILLDFIKANKMYFFWEKENVTSNRISLKTNNLDFLSFSAFAGELFKFPAGNSRWMIKGSFDKTKNEGIIILNDTDYLFNECELSETQKKAIDEALEDVKNGRVYSHEEAMRKIKSRHLKYFKK